jgi:phosphoribosyl 1,2-cyclic phosphodiesterase
MAIKTCVLASGSEGNCTYVETPNHKILFDLGTTTKYIKDSLASIQIPIEEIDYVLITHVHDDHIKALKTFIKKYKATICLSQKMYDEIEILHDYENIYIYEDKLELDDSTIEIIKTSHDTSDSRSFIIRCNNKSVVYLTDTGYINQKYFKQLTNCNIYLFESNHDIEMLQHGPYPDWLKRRVLSDEGHLSNNTSAFYLTKLIGPNTEKVMLIHLSETNNMPEVALKTLKSTLKEYNIKFSNIEIALQNERSEVTEI